MKQERNIFFTFDRVLFAFACVVLVCAFAWTPKKKVVFKKTSIVFAQWWENEMENGALRRLIDEFEAENPAITVRLETHDKDTIERMTRDAQAERTGQADVIALDGYWIPRLIKERYLYRLDDAVDFDIDEDNSAAESDKNSYDYKNFVYADGKYAVPVVLFENLLFYNIPLLASANYDRPPKSREEFFDMCKKISSGNLGVYGYAFSDDVWTDCFPWIWQAGIIMNKMPLLPGGGVQVPAFFKDRQARQEMVFLNQLNAEGLLLPFPFGFNGEEKIKAFSTGRVAMICAPVSAIKRLQALNSSLDFNVTAIPPPSNYSGRPVFTVKSWFAGIPAESGNAGSAVVFLEFLNANKAALAKAAGALSMEAESPPAQNSGRSEMYEKAKNLSANAEIIEDYYIFDDISEAGSMLIKEIRRDGKEAR
ncbi:MAG: extracellular solute-binding protein [Spirochaetaceae bacterium]|jgi:multiple sugar transport system substrate-binding protein|nr:extracellular solute-binding protein [Spirochaetaceae bacterium]